MLNEGIVQRDNYKKFDKLFSFLVTILVFTYQYASPLPGIALGEFLLVPFMGYYLLNDLYKGSFHISVNPWLALLLCQIVTTLLAAFSSHFAFGDAATLFLRLFFYGLLFAVGRKHLCLATVKKWAVITSIGFSLYLMVQVAAHEINGTYLPIYINYNWLFEPSKRESLMDLATGQFQYVFRPSSMFLEPSHFALYVIPAVVFLLDSVSAKNQNGDVRSWAALIVIGIAIVLSTSAGGIMCIGALAVYYVLFIAGINRKNIKYILIALVVAGIMLGTEYADFIRDRLNEGGSSENRIFRGLIIFEKLDGWHKLVGTGLNNIGNYMRLHGISTAFDEGNLDLMSSLMNTLVAGGIITCGAFLVCVIWFFSKAKKNLSKMAVLAFFLLSIYDVTLNTYRGALLLLIFFSVLYHQNESSSPDVC